jgi:hypothetical protein
LLIRSEDTGLTYKGHIDNGVVVLEEGIDLPNGVKVIVTLLDFLQEDSPEDESGPSLYERPEPVIGKAIGLPPDASSNVDHYLYGAPKA